MGLTAKFSTDEVARRLQHRGKATTLALRNRLGQAAHEFHEVMRMVVPYKTGTLTKAIRIKKHSPDRWTVYINEDQKVPKKRGSGAEKKPVFVRDYLEFIEDGEFGAIGPRSRKKEGVIDKRRLAGLRVKKWRESSYVGGTFYGRTLDALEIKWQKRFDKVFKSAMERGLIPSI